MQNNKSYITVMWCSKWSDRPKRQAIRETDTHTYKHIYIYNHTNGKSLMASGRQRERIILNTVKGKMQRSMALVARSVVAMFSSEFHFHNCAHIPKKPQKRNTIRISLHFIFLSCVQTSLNALCTVCIFCMPAFCLLDAVRCLNLFLGSMLQQRHHYCQNGCLLIFIGVLLCFTPLKYIHIYHHNTQSFLA